jgi:hypothetical protein
VVQLGHVRDVDEQDGQLRERIDPHLVEGEPGTVEHGVGVDVRPRLVGDLNGHCGQPPVTG